MSKRSARPLELKLSAIGERDKHLGPRWAFAKVAVSVVPAPSFEVVDEVPPSDELQSFGYPEWAVLGILEVLTVANCFPLGKVRIVLEEAQYDRIDSSRMAFREAGRDAGQKIIEEFKRNSL